MYFMALLKLEVNYHFTHRKNFEKGGATKNTLVDKIDYVTGPRTTPKIIFAPVLHLDKNEFCAEK